MRKVIYSMQISLDGYIEDASGSIDFTGPDKELHEFINRLEVQSDTHIYGRRLYELMNEYWPTITDNSGESSEIVEFAQLYNSLDIIVFSRTLTSVAKNARLADSDVITEVEKLKSREGKDIIIGGATLAQDFIEHDLIDEYRVIVYPKLIGGGKPMFGNISSKIDLELVESKGFSSGVVFLVYRPVNRGA